LKVRLFTRLSNKKVNNNIDSANGSCGKSAHIFIPPTHGSAHIKIKELNIKPVPNYGKLPCVVRGITGVQLLLGILTEADSKAKWLRNKIFDFCALTYQPLRLEYCFVNCVIMCSQKYR